MVEARLLNFRDVAELQERNIQLLAVVRELSANRLRAFQFSLMYVVFRIRIRIGSGRVTLLSGGGRRLLLKLSNPPSLEAKENFFFKFLIRLHCKIVFVYQGLRFENNSEKTICNLNVAFNWRNLLNILVT